MSELVLYIWVECYDSCKPSQPWNTKVILVLVQQSLFLTTLVPSALLIHYSHNRDCLYIKKASHKVYASVSAISSRTRNKVTSIFAPNCNVCIAYFLHNLHSVPKYFYMESNWTLYIIVHPHQNVKISCGQTKNSTFNFFAVWFIMKNRSDDRLVMDWSWLILTIHIDTMYCKYSNSNPLYKLSYGIEEGNSKSKGN